MDFNTRQRTLPPTALDMSVDEGLRAFMLSVYNKLAVGLAVAGAVAWATANFAPVRDLFFVVDGAGRLAAVTPMGMGLMWAPLIMLFGAMLLMRNPTARGATIFYWSFVALKGAGLGVIFLVYTGASIASTFFVTAAAFGALSLYGYTTKKNLTGLGTFLFMALIGLIIASVVNLFLGSATLFWIITFVGVLVFSALIAYDTQRLKLTYAMADGNREMLAGLSSWGALSLFINFVVLFQFLLSILGNRE